MGKGLPDTTGNGASRPWHDVWPSHIPWSLDYPDVSAWWILERNLEAFANRVAVRFLDHETLVEKQSLTYGSLASRAQALAAGLQGLGVNKGDRVGLYLPNSPELIVSFYGVWRAGAVAVPCNPMFKGHELAQQLHDAGARALIASAAVAANAGLAAEQKKIPLILSQTGGAKTDGALSFEELVTGAGDGPGEVAIDPREDLALLLYTGGTTGPPKGAMLTHRNIVVNTVQFAEWYAVEPGRETCVSVIPMYHSGGMSGAMNVPLYSGATLLVMSRFNPGAVARAIEGYRATRFFGVPTMYIAVLNSDEARQRDLSSLRACRTNAAPLPASVKTAFDELVGHEVLVEGYGLTETSPLTHANPIQRARAGSIGIPLPDTDARVVDLKTGAQVPPGEIGEIVIRGPQVMKGYWNRAAETRAAMKNGWFHTGDVAFMDADGYFTIVDRAKDIINTAGYKVWPREVEEVLYTHAGVELAAVVGARDDYRGEAVKAVIVPRENYKGRMTREEIVKFCKENMAAYKVPRIVEFKERLPLSGAGKVLRRLLKDDPP